MSEPTPAREPAPRAGPGDGDGNVVPTPAVVDALEAAAFQDLVDAAPAALRERYGMRTRSRAGVIALMAPGLPSTLFNRAIGLGLDRAATIDDVDWLRAQFAVAGASPWWLHWHPQAAPSGLLDALLAQGFTPARRARWRKFWRPDAAPPAVDTDLAAAAIEPTDATGAAAVAQVVVDVFELPAAFVVWLGALHGRPGWRLHALRDGSAVVGGGFTFQRAEGAWLGMGAVRPERRRRGGQRALLAARIAAAQADGARWTSTETGEPVGDEPNPSLANIVWSGYRSLGGRLNLVAPPAPPPAV